MKFISKRKYTIPFIVFLLVLIGAVTFYCIGPNYIHQSSKFFIWLLVITIVDSFLIILFIHRLYKVNYFLYSDKLEIKRSLRSPMYLNYENIEDVYEVKNDPVFLIFGKQTMFKIKYRNGSKIKKYKVRPANPNLFKLVLENERQIAIK